jgi:hypothetical protein
MFFNKARVLKLERISLIFITFGHVGEISYDLDWKRFSGQFRIRYDGMRDEFRVPVAVDVFN